ncbi:hypothetical protein EDC04DRAFT_2666590 [Pisolithus marmoratus]|nr:hypothetical protein EDC04DRAFT_2666590 [Pisolithus marmoratus]
MVPALITVSISCAVHAVCSVNLQDPKRIASLSCVGERWNHQVLFRPVRSQVSQKLRFPRWSKPIHSVGVL